MRIDLPIRLPVPTPTASSSSSFLSLPRVKPPPHHPPERNPNPSPRASNRNSHSSAKTYPTTKTTRLSHYSCTTLLQRKSQRCTTPISFVQEVLNPTPLNPVPATCHFRKRKLSCRYRKIALQKLHCNIRFSAVQKSFYQELRCSKRKTAVQP